MNSKERLDLLLQGKKADRLANISMIGSVASRCSGVTLDRYCLDYNVLVEACIKAADEFSLDYYQAATDLYREVSDFGGQIDYFEDKLPSCHQGFIKDASDVSKLHALDPLSSPRMLDLIKAVEALSKYADRYTMALITGPVTVAAMLIGTENFMINLYDEPKMITNLLNIVTENAEGFIDALSSVGAKFLYVADPVASLLPPPSYADIVLPMHKRIFDRMKSHKIHTRLHMCGNTTKILPYSRTSGAEIIDIDHAVDFEIACEILDGYAIPNGNIDPVNDVFTSNPEKINEAISKRVSAAKNHPFLIGPGCELPINTPFENIKAMGKAIAAIQLY